MCGDEKQSIAKAIEERYAKAAANAEGKSVPVNPQWLDTLRETFRGRVVDSLADWKSMELGVAYGISGEGKKKEGGTD